MKLEQTFTVAAPADRVWSALVDVERVAPCLPGAQITGSDDEGGYAGNFTVKLGPTTAAYSGRLKMEEVDESSRMATMSARGTDKRGQGGATATIVSTVRDKGGESEVDVVTDFTITGRLARFGRSGMIEDISNRLLRDFAQCLQSALAVEPAGAGAAPPPAPAGDVPAEAAGGAPPSADPDRVGTLGVPPPSEAGRQPPAETSAEAETVQLRSPEGAPPPPRPVPDAASEAETVQLPMPTPAPPPDAASPAPPPPPGGPGGEVGTAGGGGAPAPPPTGPPSPPGGQRRPAGEAPAPAEAPPPGEEPAEPAVRTESIPPPGREPPAPAPAAKPVKGLSLLASVLLGRIKRLFSRRRGG